MIFWFVYGHLFSKFRREYDGVSKYHIDTEQTKSQPECVVVCGQMWDVDVMNLQLFSSYGNKNMPNLVIS